MDDSSEMSSNELEIMTKSKEDGELMPQSANNDCNMLTIDEISSIVTECKIKLNDQKIKGFLSTNTKE